MTNRSSLFIKTALAAAAAIALAGPVMAQTVPSITEINQTIVGELDQDQFLNLIKIDSAGWAAQASLNLVAGTERTGSTQLMALQANTLGWNTLSGTSSTALWSADNALRITQTLLEGTSNVGTVTQFAPNIALVTASPVGTLAGSASILGLGQIGANTLNVAGLMLTAPSVEVVLDQNIGSGDDTLDQTVLNAMLATVAGNGSAVIDGGTGPLDAIVRSVQYGLNTVASAALFGEGNTIALQPTQVLDGDAVTSSITNIAAATAANTSVPIPAPIGGAAGILIDPVVRNLDQIAVYSANAITANNPGGTVRLVGNETFTTTAFSAGAVALDYDPTTRLYYSESDTGMLTPLAPTVADVTFSTQRDEQSISGFDDNLAAINVAWASNGTFGDSAVEKISQTIAASLNTVRIAGTAAVAAEGSNPAVPANPANAAVGQLLYGGLLPADYAVSGMAGTQVPLADGTYAVALKSFDQRIDQLTISALTTDSDGAISQGNYSTTPDLMAPVTAPVIVTPNAVVGNWAGVDTDIGNGVLSKLQQVISVSGNIFSVDGNLTGAVLPAQPAVGPAQYTYYSGTNTDIGTSDLALATNWSMTQTAIGVDVTLPNYAGVLVDTGNATVSGIDQTLVTQLNALTVGRNLSGNFLQQAALDGSAAGATGDAVTLNFNNLIQASTRLGNINGTEASEQLFAAQINNLSVGGNFSGVIAQRADAITVGGLVGAGLPDLTAAAFTGQSGMLSDLGADPALNAVVLNVAGLGAIDAGSFSQTGVAVLNNLTIGGTVGTDTVQSTLDQYASSTTGITSIANYFEASTNLGTVQLAGLSQTISSSVNTMALGDALNARVSQLVTGGIAQEGVNIANIGGAGASAASVHGITQAVINRVNSITTGRTPGGQ